MPVTPAYAALFAVFFVALSVRTLRLRRKLGVAVGFGGDPALERAVRVHGNFAEYVPITLVLIYFLELLAGGGMWIHLLCLVLLAGRILHACGVSQVAETFRYRVVGMALTFTSLLGAAAGILLAYV